MTTLESRSTKDLFRQWRSGDAEAGQAMAQRFADWYYAIATSRLGEKNGREPCERACARFGEGIIQQTDSRQLVKWAHSLISDEVIKHGGRAAGGDEPSAYSGNQSPQDLLNRARPHLGAEIRLLGACYGGADEAEVARIAEPLGGMPMAVLQARYRVKQWLRDEGLPIEVAPDDPVLDRAPLPMYEAGRMASLAEETNFEQWMLSDLDLCKDIAEFSAFALALRGGVGSDAQGNQDASGDGEGMGTAGKAALGGFALVAGMAVVAFLLVAVLATAYFATR